MSPRTLYQLVARAEAVTWALLLTGMFLKYVTDTTEVGVTIAGPIHGFVFIAYCFVTGLLWVDQKWSFGRFVAGLACAVPPFASIPFEMSVERKGLISQEWRLRSESPRGALEKLVSWLVRNPLQGLAVGVVAVVVLFVAALFAGPPV